MHLTFRQGIARYQTDVYATPTFLQKSSLSGEFIDLVVSPDPTIIIFAHRTATYVIEESKTVTHAWGPFATSGTKYLYWDINLLDASLTRGFTSLPIIIAGTLPLNPAVDQHWFDTSLNQMKVWNGSKWLDKVRVFAATYSSSAVIQPSPLGTQVGLNGNFEAGNLVLDSYSKPLRQSDGTFVTSTTELTIINAASKTVKFEAEVFSGMADEYIPMFSFVQTRQNHKIILARSDDWRSRVIGLVVEDLFQSEVGTVVTDGLVRNEQWSWPSTAIGRPVFCGVTGEVTLTPPVVGVSQVVGYVYDIDSIVVNIHGATILDDISSLPPVAAPPPALAPIADFFGTPRVGTVPLTVTFTSTSLHAPTSLEWDFKNLGVVNATTAEASYTYTAAGTYDVKLRAINGFGQDTEIKTGFITVNPAVETGTFTNLGIQLGGPLQVSTSQVFTVAVTISNDGTRTASNVTRIITIDDVSGSPISVSNLPTGAVATHIGSSTVIAMPLLTVLNSGQFSNSSFSITAPAVKVMIEMRASVGSPETDSTLSDNVTTLSIRVK